MLTNVRKVRFLALLLGIVFLAAQFHFCADLTSGPSSSHICPVCSTTGSVVAPVAPSIALVAVANRLEIFPLSSFFSAALPRAVSARAPPSL
jgi:hypothetical protein